MLPAKAYHPAADPPLLSQILAFGVHGTPPHFPQVGVAHDPGSKAQCNAEREETPGCTSNDAGDAQGGDQTAAVWLVGVPRMLRPDFSMLFWLVVIAQ
jgi:hypothetical protein